MDLNEVIEWLRLNKLSLNAGKTELIYFHSHANPSECDLDKIFINFDYVRLNPVDNVKYLGMYVDKYLSWNQHNRELSKLLSKWNSPI